MLSVLCEAPLIVLKVFNIVVSKVMNKFFNALYEKN